MYMAMILIKARACGSQELTASFMIPPYRYVRTGSLAAPIAASDFLRCFAIRASKLQAPPPAVISHKKKKQLSTASSPLFRIGKKTMPGSVHLRREVK
jgi:hypothetical protein